ncbi:MAG: helix-turn-helix transcriptional regulator [Candidatus Tectomicrobia bacterium]|nr:helix-turn-helix transcriptional regulator [Rhodospirillaceae bacterium]MDE0207651.1 helix-turn-helix transcriptional regulator [Candidatus Tectomicrobia bacterium]
MPSRTRKIAHDVSNPALKDRLRALDFRLTGVENDLAAIKSLLSTRLHIDPAFVAERLNLTPRESQVAVALAKGLTVRGIAETAGRKEGTIRHHIKSANRKLGISRQADLIRLLLPNEVGPTAGRYEKGRHDG